MGATEQTWECLIHWADLASRTIDFRAGERQYKVSVAEQLAGARQAMLDGDADWLERFRKAFRAKNLVYPITKSKFMEELGRRDDHGRSVILHVWGDEPPRIDDLAEDLASHAIKSFSSGDIASVASALLMGRSVEAYPPYRATGVAECFEAVGLTALGSGHSAGERYGQFLDLLDELLRRGKDAGLDLRDRLDAQAILWTLTQWPVEKVAESWSEQDSAAFRQWRGVSVDEEDPVVAAEPDVDAPTQGAGILAAATDGLARNLHLRKGQIQEWIDLLASRRQFVFYGPPGTGKTFIARALASHVTGGLKDRYRLVQFHPSYAYEDFFEGFRPQLQDGQATFRLQPGPLRIVAEAAAENSDTPFVLVIDEMNRANLAKVFGELYFLLEYRDESVFLQYSPAQRFALPDNLFIIATMNTADRSIAMVDAAIRRRFAFVELHPSSPPVRGLLEEFLADEGRDRTPARLLHALNTAMGDANRDFHIGPSYFMKEESSTDAGLERIWRYDIMPLLAERFYGRYTQSQLEDRYGYEAISAAAAPKEDVDDDSSDGAVGAQSDASPGAVAAAHDTAETGAQESERG